MDAAIFDRAIAKARLRLLPFLVLMYVLAFIDRSNVGFAKNALQADTGISDAAFAFGASIFFVGYAIFEVPSNLLMYRFGARVWMSRIMVTWGLVSACTAFTHGSASFYALRLLLGIGEAGFFPGVIFYLTQWFPRQNRAQAVGIFYFGLPLAQIIGSPFSGVLLDVTAPFGLQPWQSLFVIEGLLACVVGVVAFFYLADRPADARWLSLSEQQALTGALDLEDAAKRQHGNPGTVLAAFRDPRVLVFCAIYFTVQISVYGVVFYLPARIAELTGGHIGSAVGVITIIPWLAAVGVTFFIARLADRYGRHRHWAATMLMMAALGIGGSAFCDSLPLVVAAFCIAAAGFVTVQPLFWTLPTGYLSGIAAAGGIGLINAVGNLGGFIAPNLKVFVEQVSALPGMGMLALSCAGLAGAALLVGLGDTETREQRPFSSHGY